MVNQRTIYNEATGRTQIMLQVDHLTKEQAFILGDRINTKSIRFELENLVGNSGFFAKEVTGLKLSKVILDIMCKLHVILKKSSDSWRILPATNE